MQRRKNIDKRIRKKKNERFGEAFEMIQRRSVESSYIVNEVQKIGWL